MQKKKAQKPCQNAFTAANTAKNCSQGAVAGQGRGEHWLGVAVCKGRARNAFAAQLFASGAQKYAAQICEHELSEQSCPWAPATPINYAYVFRAAGDE